VTFDDGGTTASQIYVSATNSAFNHTHPSGANRQGIIDLTPNLLDVDFNFQNCTFSSQGRMIGFSIEGNEPVRDCDWTFSNCTIANFGASQNEGIFIQSSHATNRDNTLTVDHCILDTSSGLGQGRNINFNLGGNKSVAPTNAMTVSNSLLIVYGDDTPVTYDSEPGFSTSNQECCVGSQGWNTAVFTHCTFVARAATAFSGIWAHVEQTGGAGLDGSLELYNNIFWNFKGGKNSDAGVHKFGAIYNQDDAVITHSGNVVAGIQTDPSLAPLVGDLVTTPSVFVDSAGGDYHLSSSSPALGNFAGTTDKGLTDDLEGNGRPSPALSLPDAGAYESVEVPVTLSTFRIE